MPATEKTYCAGNEHTFQFLQEVLDEVVEMFPSQYIHVGGDEVAKTAWQNCLKCQERMKTEGLENHDELQSYFIRRMEKHVTAKGRRLIGWDEMLEGRSRAQCHRDELARHGRRHGGRHGRSRRES